MMGNGCGGSAGMVGGVLGNRRRLAAHLRVPVDDDVGDVGEQLAGPVLALRKLEQFRRLVEEARGDVAGEELRVRDRG